MITINYTRQTTGTHAGLRSIQFVLDENLGLDGMLHELTQFLRAMGYPIDSDETLLVMAEDEIDLLQKQYDIQQLEVEKVLQELVEEANDDKE